MKNNMFKKITAVVLTLTMVAGLSSVAMARANNGQNVATQSWASFSINTKEDGGVWYDALVEAAKDNPDAMSYTEGWIVPGTSDSSKFSFYVHNSGWDGEWNPYTNELVADCPWGLTAAMASIPVEHDRYYNISFKIKSTLKASNEVKDETGNPVYDENGQKVTEDITKKHVLVTLTSDATNGGSAEIITAENCSTGGYIELDATNEDFTNVSMTVKIPAANVFKGDKLTFKFVMGAMLVSYPDEVAQKGYIDVKDFKVEAGHQHKVVLSGNGKSFTKYVNDGETVESLAIGKVGYTLVGFTDKATGALYNFYSPVTKDMNLEAKYTKTKKPAKAKISKAKSSAKKKVKVTLKKTKNAVGYQIKYSYKRNMKAAKTKNTKKVNYTIKKLKSRKIVYIQARAYVLDSMGGKVYGKWSAKKKAYVK